MTNQAAAFLLVFIGGGLGSMLRYAVNQASAVLGTTFPFGTLFVNIVGSFIIGLLAAWLALRSEASETLRVFLATGILGGFTTFSAFSLDTAMLWERGATSATVLYVAGSVLLSLIAVFCGMVLARALFAPAL